jgi:hypothetical protein
MIMKSVSQKTLSLVLLCFFCFDATQAAVFETNIGNIMACPRCRRVVPLGPRKRPTPPVTKKRDKAPESLSLNNNFKK